VRTRAKVTIDNLTAYRKSHIRNQLVPKMNDIDLCLEVVQGHVNHCGINSSKTTWARDFKFGTRLCMGNAEPAHN